MNQKVPLDGFENWTAKQNQYSVQPPLHVLNHNYTIRIHLDDTYEQNGALKVIPGSHLKNIYKPETIDLRNETYCNVTSGGIMIMKPLLMLVLQKLYILIDTEN